MSSEVAFDYDSWSAKLAALLISSDVGKKIISVIERNGECTASELAKTLNIPLPTVLYHLSRLEMANIITYRKRLGKRLREVKSYMLRARKLVFNIGGDKDDE